MDELRLCDEISAAQKDKVALLELVTRFTPLLKKYANLLRYEDAYFDLQLDFIELISNFKLDKMLKTDNGALLSYIKKAIYNQYIKRSKANNEYLINNNTISDMSDEQVAVISIKFSVVDNYDVMCFKEYKDYLTQQEFEVILLIFYFGYEVSEIARNKKVSRQAINQLKNRALSKLRRHFFDT